MKDDGCHAREHGTPVRLWGWGEKMGMKLTRRAGRADAEQEAGAHVQFLLKLVTFLRGGSPDATSHGAAPRPPCPFATSEILHAAPATLTEPWTHGTLDSRNLGLTEPLDAALDPEMERLRFSA